MSDYDNLRKMSGCKPRSPEFRFANSYSPEAITGCWLWLGVERGSNGYGRITVNKKIVPAHRYSYELHFGQIPKGMLVLHSCDTPLCVNPAHLFLGTHQENMNDKVRKGRQSKGESLSIAQNNQSRCGENSATSKLTTDDVVAIKTLNKSTRKLADLFNVSQALIYAIKAGKTWKHIQI